MFIWTFLLRITHTIISRSTADSSWITLYTYSTDQSSYLWLGLIVLYQCYFLFVTINCAKRLGIFKYWFRCVTDFLSYLIYYTGLWNKTSLIQQIWKWLFLTFLLLAYLIVVCSLILRKYSKFVCLVVDGRNALSSFTGTCSRSYMKSYIYIYIYIISLHFTYCVTFTL